MDHYTLPLERQQAENYNLKRSHRWPWFKQDAAEFLLQTHHLSLAACGAHGRIHAQLWRRPDGTLPADDQTLAHAALCTVQEWQAVKDEVLPLFEQEDGKIWDAELENQRLETESFLENRRKAGRASAAKRAEKSKESNTRSTPVQHVFNKKRREEERREDTKKEKNTPPEVALPAWIQPEIWNAFTEVRKKIRAPLTPKAASLIIRELETFRGQGHDPNKLLERSIMNGWRGVFVKDDGNNGNGAARPAGVSMSEKVEAAKRKLWEEGYTLECTLDIQRLKTHLFQSMREADWTAKIKPLWPGCANATGELVCFCPVGIAIDAAALEMASKELNLKYTKVEVRPI